MPINKKYRPDYGKLYPGEEIPPKVLEALKKSDRKMKYMEYDLKTERPVKDENGVLTGLLPGREDSLERLMETDNQFMAAAPSPEQIVEERGESAELHRCLAILDADERSLITALFFDGVTVRKYAAISGVSKSKVDRDKKKVLEKLQNLLQRFGF